MIVVNLNLKQIDKNIKITINFIKKVIYYKIYSY